MRVTDILLGTGVYSPSEKYIFHDYNPRIYEFNLEDIEWYKQMGQTRHEYVLYQNSKVVEIDDITRWVGSRNIMEMQDGLDIIANPDEYDRIINLHNEYNEILINSGSLKLNRRITLYQKRVRTCIDENTVHHYIGIPFDPQTIIKFKGDSKLYYFYTTFASTASRVANCIISGHDGIYRR